MGRSEKPLNYSTAPCNLIEMASKIMQLGYLSLAAIILTGCGSEDSSDNSSGSSGGNYMSCVLEYNDAVRAGVLDATQSEIMEDCRSQYSPG
jgi:uncharacterized protein YgiB involved in biofilm formation